MSLADLIFDDDSGPSTDHKPSNFSVRDVVNVLPRTYVGMNKLGGRARVRPLHP